MQVDTPALCAGFSRPDGRRDDVVKHPQLPIIRGVEKVDDILRVDGSHVCHGNQDTGDAQLRIDLPAHLR